MVSKPWLSIVTISFNQAEFLGQAIESVLAEKRSDVEYIVVDPGSTDGSREIIQQFAARIDRVIFEPDDGPADGLNRGFKCAGGEIGYFLNSDDLLLPGAIERMRRVWRANPSADLVLGGAWRISREGKPDRELRPFPITLGGLARGSGVIVQQGLSFRLSAFRHVGGFNPANRTCWDSELVADLIASDAVFALADDRFGAFRFHDASISGGVGGQTHLERYFADLDRIFFKHFGQVRRPPNIWLARSRRLLFRPMAVLQQALDSLFRSRIQGRWIRDLHSAVSRG